MRPVLFGEVLFDCFPDGARVLGGAPFNVAWHLQAFGQAPLLISAVGNDADGETLLAAMQAWGMDVSGIQQSTDYPTGRVAVSFSNTEPTYDICADSAWDYVQVAKLPALPAGMLLYHGSLAARSAASRATLQRLKAEDGIYTYCDINLRLPHWSAVQQQVCLADVDMLKLNSDELALLYPGSTATKDGLGLVMSKLQLDGLILTRGSAGAIALVKPGPLVHEGSVSSHEQVVDTVGAGDAFSSVCLLGICQGWSTEETLHRAHQFASGIVGVRGATVNDRYFYQQYLDSWSQQGD